MSKIKVKTRPEVREALTQGTLFSSVVLNDRDVTFTLAKEFEAPCHHRVINQVLKTLRNTSSLKNEIYDIKNVNRYPALTLTKKHQFTDGKAILNALIAALAPAVLQPTDKNIQSEHQPDVAFWDFLEQQCSELDLDMDIDSISSPAYTSRNSSTEDFFECLFPDVNPMLFGFTQALDQSTANALDDSIRATDASITLALEMFNAEQGSSKENIDLGYKF